MENVFEDNVTFLYENARRLNTPVKYLVIQFNHISDADNYRNGNVYTVFDLFKGLKDEQMDIVDIYYYIQDSMYGQKLQLGDIIPVYFHSVLGLKENVDINTNDFINYVKNLAEKDNNELLFEDIKTLYTDIGRNLPFTDFISAYNYYVNTWYPSFREQFRYDMNRLDILERSRDEMNELEGVEIGEKDINKVVLIYEELYEFNPLPDIFNNSNTSFTVPFIQYNIDKVSDVNEKDPRYYKIYKGSNSINITKFNNIIPDIALTSDAQTIYLNIWMDERSEFEEEIASKAPKLSFKLASITWTGTSILFTVPSPVNEDVNEIDIINRLHEHINVDKPTRYNMIRLSGTISYYFVEMNLIPFLDIITNDSIFSNYYYVDDSNKITMTGRFKYKGVLLDKETKSSKNLTAITTHHKAYRGKKIILFDGEEMTLPRSNYTDYLILKFDKAASNNLLDQFIRVTSKLFARLIDREEEINNIYIKYIPEYEEYLINRPLVAPEVESIYGPPPMEDLKGTNYYPLNLDSKISYLSKFAPDIFVRGYPRRCQKISQPLVINQKDIEFWENRLVTRAGIKEKRQVLSFPEDDPFYYFVCPGDLYKYPSLIENKVLSNREEYPFIPCCHITNSVADPESDLSKIYGTDEEFNENQILNPITTNKILNLGRLGVLPTTLNEYFSSFIEGTMFRIGIPKVTDSFIHAVALAMDEEYIDVEDKKEYSLNIRREIAEFNPSLYKQELSDFTDEEIISNILNEDIFFDPLLYYRGIEEYYNITIMIFNYTGEDHKNKNAISYLELPNHKLFYTRPKNDRPIVLILRHWGAESNQREYPHCELLGNIVDTEDGSIIEYIFKDEEQINELWNAFDFIQRTITWEVNDEVTAKMNSYSIINWYDIFGDRITGQILDDYGKVRIFEIDELIYISVPPTQPLNINELDINNLSVPSIRDIKSILGEYTSVNVLDNKINGVWYSMGDLEAFCQCKPFKLKESMEVNENNDAFIIPTDVNDPIYRYKRMKKTSEYIKQIVKYLYILSGKIDLDEFFEELMVLNEGDDSDEIYNIDGLDRILPGGNYNEVINALTEVGMLEDGKLVLYNEDMLNGLYYEMNIFADKVMDIDYDVNILRPLKHFYEDKFDIYYDADHEFLLSSLYEYERWSNVYTISSNLQQRDIQNLRENIQSRLSSLAFTYTQPYIFRRSNDTIIKNSLNPSNDEYYMIQSVIRGELNRAINVAINWKEDNKNIGHNAEEYKDELPSYSIYGIAPGGNIMLREGSEDNEIKILDYYFSGQSLYAAMLPL